MPRGDLTCSLLKMFFELNVCAVFLVILKYKKILLKVKNYPYFIKRKGCFKYTVSFTFIMCGPLEIHYFKLYI